MIKNKQIFKIQVKNKTLEKKQIQHYKMKSIWYKQQR